MARIKLTVELKKEVSQLSSKEKDRLLFRLLPTNTKLVHQLEYKLVEQESTLEMRIDDLREDIQRYIDKYPKNYYSPLYLRGEMREMSGRISYHVAVTKDKISEIDFNLMMLNGIIGANISKLQSSNWYSCEKFNDYVVKRAIKLVKLINALHEDYKLEYADEMSTLADHIESIESMGFVLKSQL